VKNILFIFFELGKINVLVYDGIRSGRTLLLCDALAWTRTKGEEVKILVGVEIVFIPKSFFVRNIAVCIGPLTIK
jgi:hypothetical protein